ERFKDLLRQCPHHGFSELQKLDTFYNALNPNDQDALYSVAGGNFLDKIPRECLSIIESKSKEIAASLEDKLDIRMNCFEKSLNDLKNSFVTPTAPIKAVEECMRTRRLYFPQTSTIPRRSRKQTTNVVEPEIRTIVEMADNRTMAQMLQENKPET
nr:reverse transcriptase domain-containing protein [Tanacetum cinerariifolium]